MKFNIVKKAFAVVLAAALVTTGMPVEMAGAGVVQAATSPVDVKLGDCTVTAKVESKSYPNRPGVGDVTVTIKEGSTVVGEGTLAALSAHIDTNYYGVITDYFENCSNSVGTHNGKFTIKGKTDSGLSGTKEVSFSYTITKSTKAKLQFTNTNITGDGIVVGSSGFVKAKVYTPYTNDEGDEQLFEEKDAEIQYGLMTDNGVVSVNSTTGEYTCLKRGVAYVTATSAATDNYAEPSLADLCKITVGKGTSEFKVQEEVINLINKESTTIVPINNKGKVTYAIKDGSDDCVTLDAETGKITAKAAPTTGKAVIIATDAGDDNYGPAPVEVTVNVTTEKGDFTLSTNSTSVVAGATVSIPYTTSGGGDVTTDADDDSNEYVSVSKQGTNLVILGKKVGSTKVKVTQEADIDYPAITATITVEVTGKANSFALSSETANVKVGETVNVAYTGATELGTITTNVVEGSTGNATASVEKGTTSGAGNIKILATKIGTVTMAVTDSGNDEISKSEKTLTITVTGNDSAFAIASSAASVKVGGDTTVNYTGAAGEVTATTALGTTGAVTATAANGVVTITGTKAGEASIVVKDAGNDTVAASEKTIAVTVTQDASEFDVEFTTASMVYGEKAEVAFTGAAGDVTTEVVDGTGSVSATSNKYKVTITGTKAGKATVKVKDSGSATVAPSEKTIEVTVSKAKNTTFALNSKSMALTVGKSGVVSVKDKVGTVSAKVKSGSAVTVSGTTIKAAKAGTAVVTITDAGDNNYESASADVTVTVTKNASTFKLTKASASVTCGKTHTIAYTNAAGKVTFTSGSTGVAKVSAKGVITPVKAGTAKITVKDAGSNSKSGTSKTFTVTVKRASQKITVNKSSVSLANKGKAATIKVSKANGRKVTYKSSDTKVATVNSKGKITAKKKGTCKITVTAAQSGQYTKSTATVKVTVKK